MKKNFISGVIVGGLVFGAVGAFAGQYVATENYFPVKLNGEQIPLIGYNIEGSTYFKLRDIADKVGGFTVGFDNNTIQLAKDGYSYQSPQNSEQVIRSILSAPLDTADEVAQYYSTGDFYMSGNFYIKINYAGGISLNWCAKNLSDKTIKYITMSMSLYNAVGDKITDDFGNQDFTVKIVGPFNARDGFRYFSSRPFAYTDVCSKLSIDDMIIEFMDGTTVSGNYGYSTTIIR